MSARHGEKGGSTLSNIFWLVALVAFGYACWNFIPAYYNHYSLHDRALEYCRQMPGPNATDSIIIQKLMRDVEELKLDPYIYPQNIKVTTKEGSRAIRIEYQREIPIVPGYKYSWNKPIDVSAPYY